MAMILETTPEIREAIDALQPVAKAATAFVDCVDAKGSSAMCTGEYDALSAAVERRKRYQREHKALRAVK